MNKKLEQDTKEIMQIIHNEKQLSIEQYEAIENKIIKILDK